MTEPQRQARWSILLRSLLAAPNVLVLALVECAVLPVLVVVWLWALVAGRPPAPLWRFLRGVVQWQARTAAYGYLLAAAYPPFTLGDAPYPVTASLGGTPPRLRRLAVLVRSFVALPAVVVADVLASGAALFAVVSWLAALALGRVPRPLHVFLAVLLRYTLRCTAYCWMLTPEYPWGPLGDHSGDWHSLERGTLTVTGSARGIAIAALVLGIVWTVAAGALGPALAGARSQRTVALEQWDALGTRAANASAQYRTKAASCATSLSCAQGAVAILGASVATQIRSLRAIRLPTAATRRDRADLLPLLRQELRILDSMEQAPDAQAYVTAAHQLESVTRHLVQVARRLASDLSGSG